MPNALTRPRLTAIVAMAVLAASATGCGVRRMPDMSRPTEIARMSGPRQPLILIHGFLGARLRDPETHRVAWGNMANVLRGGDTDDLALALDDADRDAPGESLEAYEIYDSLWGIDYYREVLRSLEEAGGYQFGDIDHPRPGDNAFVFVYDWRRDNVETARRLGEIIDRLKAARGRPDERFDLLAHSQGGLIARYYIKYGTRDVVTAGPPFGPDMAGAAHVNKVILIGTPNRGCLESLRILHQGVKKIFRPMRPEVVFTMPAVFQMLPPPGTALFADEAGEPIALDLYDPDTWERQQWSVFSPESQKRLLRKVARGNAAALARHNDRLRAVLADRLREARLFQEALDAPAAGEEAVAYHAFGSDCVSTLKAAIVTERDGQPRLAFDEDGILDEGVRAKLEGILYGPGDGIVLMQSLLGLPEDRPGEAVRFGSAFFVCGQHGVLPNDPIFQNNLLYLLLWKGDRQQLSVR